MARRLVPQLLAVKRAAATAHLVSSCKIALASPDATAALGRLVACCGPAIGAGTVVCLDGDLGAGKTVFSRGFVRSAVDNEATEVVSPTFLIDLTYEMPVDGLTLHHVDAYRLRGPEDMAGIGLDVAMRHDVVLIEWASRVAGAVPADRLDVEVTVDLDALHAHESRGAADSGSDDEGAAYEDTLPRLATLRATGAVWQQRLGHVAQELS